MKIAYLFPGQGSQCTGMGKELAAAYPEAKAVFDEADELLGFSPFDEKEFGTTKQALQNAIYHLGIF